VAVLALALRFFISLGNANGEKDYTLEFSSAKLVVGETATATVAGLPEGDTGKVNFSSSDSEIVKIDTDGTMHAKKVGDATIAASVNGKNMSRTIRVIELLEGVKSVILDQTTAAILSGETLQLKASVELETNENVSPPLIWSSSNTAVARVSPDGLVTARDVGTASITATLGNQSAVCIITVQKNLNSEPVQSSEGTDTQDNTTNNTTDNTNNKTNSSDSNTSTGSNQSTADASKTSGSTSNTTAKSLTLSQGFAYLNVNQTMALEAAVSPAGTSVSWSSSDKNLATVSPAGIVTAKAAGSVEITAKAGTLTASCTIQIDPAIEDGEQDQTQQAPE
jgi:uncharacterized protein YjdB